MANRTLTSADAIVSAMLLDAQGSAMSITLVAKDVLAARWQVWLTIMRQTVGLTVILELNSLPAPGCQKSFSQSILRSKSAQKEGMPAQPSQTISFTCAFMPSLTNWDPGDDTIIASAIRLAGNRAKKISMGEGISRRLGEGLGLLTTKSGQGRP